VERHTIPNLSDMVHTVSPKADGVRVALHCDQKSGKISLLKQLRGERLVVPMEQSSPFGGYLIEAEEVSLADGKALLLAFDLLAVDDRTILHYNFDRFKTVLHQQGLKRIQSAMPHMKMLSCLVQDANVPNLILKPRWPWHEAESVWSMADRLPYPVNGLVFSPALDSTLLLGSSDLKWKPSTKLTLDVALSSAEHMTESGGFFAAFLYNPATSPGMDTQVPSEHYHRHANHVGFGVSVQEGGSIQLTLEAEATMKVWLDENHAQWAAYGVAEVIYDGKKGELGFVHLRRDRN